MKQIVRNMQKYFSGFSVENPTLNTVNLELTNICDLHCVMCKQSQRPKGYMDIQLAADILAEAAKLNVKQIALHTVGESILHPKIGEIIRLSKQYDFYVYLDVNGNSLDQKKAEEIINAGLDSIKFSVDAATNDTYGKIRRGGDFTKVFENMKYLRSLRDEKKSSLKLFTLFIISRDNEHELEQFKEIMRPVVDEIQYNILNNAAGRMRKEQFNEIQLEKFCVPNDLGLCANPFTRLVITWQGEVSMCCIDFNLDMHIGTYQRGNLMQIWNGDRAWKVRRAMIEKREEDLPIICRSCDAIRFDTPQRNKIINEIFK